MRKPWLIQRLKPTLGVKKNKMLSIFNPSTDGFTDEGFNILSQIFRFDYMGSAEFEWGAIPEFFDKFVKELKHYRAGSINIKGHTVYFVAPEGSTWDEFIKETLVGLYDYSILTKEFTGFQESLENKKYADYVGWIDLDNKWIFFRNKKVFKNFCAVFGIKNG